MATATTKKKADKKPAEKKVRKAPEGAVAAKKPATANDETPKAPVTTSSKFEIRNDMPCPPRTRTGGGATIYPLAGLDKIGKYFTVPNEVDKDLYTTEAEYKAAVQEEKRAIQNRLTGAARRYIKSNPEVKLAVRVLKDGTVGVWRVETTE